MTVTVILLLTSLLLRLGYRANRALWVDDAAEAGMHNGGSPCDVSYSFVCGTERGGAGLRLLDQ